MAVFGRPTVYAPAIWIVSAGKGANSHPWMAQGVRRLLFDPMGVRLILPLPQPSTSGGRSVMVFSGESVGWGLHVGDAL